MTTLDQLVEAGARALYEEDDVWHIAFPWPNPDGIGARENYLRLSRAHLAAILPLLADDLAWAIAMLGGANSVSHEIAIRTRISALMEGKPA